MAQVPEYARKYLLTGLTATPDVLEALLADLKADDPRWNFTPDPERFTLKAIVAHLADWDPIFHGRIVRTRDEHDPQLPDVDEGAVAIANDYPNSDPIANLKRFREERTKLVETLRALDSAQWDRVAHRHFGPITMLQQGVLIIGHDGYHTQQVAQWLKAYK